MKTIDMHELHKLSSGLQVIPYEKRHCWYLCIVIAPSDQRIFNYFDIVAISQQELLKRNRNKDSNKSEHIQETRRRIFKYIQYLPTR